MLLERYEVDPQYFIDKYNVPLLERKGRKTAQREKQGLALPEGRHPFFD